MSRLRGSGLNVFLRAIGALVLVFSIFLSLSLATFDKDDPSPNNATPHIPRNLCGYYGAFIADPLAQSLGFASASICLFLITLGLKLLLKGGTSFFLMRLSLLILFLPVFSTICAFLGKPADSSLFSYGGFIGSFCLDELLLYFPHDTVLYILSAIALIALFPISNLSFSDLKWSLLLMFRFLVYSLRLIKWSIILLALKLRKVKYENQYNKADDEGYEIDLPAKPTAHKMPKFEQVRKSTPPTKIRTDAFKLPSTNLLSAQHLTSKKNNISEAVLNQNAKLLEQVLQDFGVNGDITNIRPGPVVTLYELEPAAGTKSSRVIGLSDDIARSMSAISARISVIAGKNALGIELPNTIRETVFLRELLEASEYTTSERQLPLVLGKNIAGAPVVADLAKMPHLLVAGTTGSGKSVAINTMILSLLYKLSPKECQFIMIDPKMLELSVYEGIPHLLTPVVTEPKKAVVALKWVVKEMEERYRSMSLLGVRNIQGFNKAITEAIEKGQKLEKQVQTGFDKETGKPLFEPIAMPTEPLPYIVVIVDEMADLMLVAGKDIEGYIQRLAQMARAAGIHIIMATQRPSVDVITGVIKANFPTRISFQVTSKIDSRTILGEQGAEQLLGMGDMLYMMGGGRIERVHGPFVGDKEVEMVVAHLKEQGTPQYRNEITIDEDEDSNSPLDIEGGDDLYSQAVAIVIRDRRPTTSYLQRCLKIGYNKAASLIEKMEKEGVLSPPSHTGKREILVD